VYKILESLGGDAHARIRATYFRVYVLGWLTAQACNYSIFHCLIGIGGALSILTVMRRHWVSRCLTVCTRTRACARLTLMLRVLYVHRFAARGGATKRLVEMARALPPGSVRGTVITPARAVAAAQGGEFVLLWNNCQLTDPSWRTVYTLAVKELACAN